MPSSVIYSYPPPSHKHGYQSARWQRENPVTRHSQEARDSTRVYRHADDLGVRLIVEDVVQQLLCPLVMLRMRLAVISLPQLICLTEPIFNRPLRIGFVNRRARRAAITGMLTHDLPGVLLHQRRESNKTHVRPSKVASMQTPHQWTYDPFPRLRHTSFFQHTLQELPGITRLLLPELRQLCIRPNVGAVAVEFGPVVVPGFGAIE